MREGVLASSGSHSRKEQMFFSYKPSFLHYLIYKSIFINLTFNLETLDLHVLIFSVPVLSIHHLCNGLSSHSSAVSLLTWVISLQQVPAVESSAFGVAHLQALLQQPLGDVTLADACVPEARHVILTL